ncbi:hypothetical protein E4U43_007847 [Claviceps pusilla]|uniref:Uncharacterized protein n=1 Tax=Claviceps pusilla TaxID=123648 RepID=A0A9P7T1B5_9HYPO|nr:hypothetical protein E4U43_007847 [Claviceps pusilla]
MHDPSSGRTSHGINQPIQCGGTTETILTHGAGLSSEEKVRSNVPSSSSPSRPRCLGHAFIAAAWWVESENGERVKRIA